MKKYLIFDAGPIINFAMNGLLPLLEKLKENFNGDFIITKEVKNEIIDYPLTTKKYELEALQIKRLFDKGILKHADITDIEIEKLIKIRDNLMQIGNSTFYARNKPIHIIDKGECASLALANILGKNTLLVIDERTARLLSEDPGSLKIHLEKKLHTKIIAKTDNYESFKGYKIIRSTELAYIALKKRLIDIDNKNLPKALINALRLKGCSISEDETEELITILSK